MYGFLLALQFLTIVPVKIKNFQEKHLAGSLVYFPLVGFLLGVVLVFANHLLGFLGLANLTISVIVVVLLIILTAGIHLDGLADTADAFLSRKNKEEMLLIMRDSHIGVMGVISLVCVILLKIALLYSLNPGLKANAIILMCALSRWSQVLVIFLFPYARQEGKAKAYIKEINLSIFALSTITAAVIAFFFFRFEGLLIMVLVTASAYLFSRLVNNKIQGITGDTIGAVSEITEVSTLFSILILSSIWI